MRDAGGIPGSGLWAVVPGLTADFKLEIDCLSLFSWDTFFLLHLFLDLYLLSNIYLDFYFGVRAILIPCTWSQLLHTCRCSRSP